MREIKGIAIRLRQMNEEGASMSSQHWLMDQAVKRINLLRATLCNTYLSDREHEALDKVLEPITVRDEDIFVAILESDDPRGIKLNEKDNTPIFMAEEIERLIANPRHHPWPRRENFDFGAALNGQEY